MDKTKVYVIVRNLINETYECDVHDGEFDLDKYKKDVSKCKVLETEVCDVTLSGASAEAIADGKTDKVKFSYNLVEENDGYAVYEFNLCGYDYHIKCIEKEVYTMNGNNYITIKDELYQINEPTKQVKIRDDGQCYFDL